MKNLKKILRPIYKPVLSWHYDTFKAPKRYHHLYDTIQELEAKTIVEVGTWNGERALKMIAKAQQVTGDENVHYIGFDLFEEMTNELYETEVSKRPPTESFVESLLNVTGANITLVKGNTLKTLPEYVKSAGKADFIFIDGGHNVDTIQSDWVNVSQLMHERTVVIFDDYWMNRPNESAKPVIDNIDKTRYDIEIMPGIDKFNNRDFGKLEISFAKVTKK